MHSLKPLVVTGMLVAVAAFPAGALDLGTSATSDMSFEHGIALTADAEVTVNADGTRDVPEMPEGYVVTTDSTFLGNRVLTSDGTELGNVTDVYAASGQTPRVRVELDDDLGVDLADAFWLAIAADGPSDGTLVLPMTFAEFQSQAAAQTDGRG